MPQYSGCYTRTSGCSNCYIENVHYEMRCDSQMWTFNITIYENIFNLNIKLYLLLGTLLRLNVSGSEQPA